MPKRDLTLTSKFILALHQAEDLMIPLVSMKDLQQRMLYPGSYDSFRSIYHRLKKRGLLKYIEYKKHPFIALTQKGQLEVLMMKARLPGQVAWDGKWRVIIFDIPEEANNSRNKLRRLLLQNNFKKLQASVFISPHPLNREAVAYLKECKLMDYIRILKVEEVDDDTDLKKKFALV